MLTKIKYCHASFIWIFLNFVVAAKRVRHATKQHAANIYILTQEKMNKNEGKKRQNITKTTTHFKYKIRKYL